MKEMLGGCCVCADENGWSDNPLIYCDGPGCEVAVHQGCYGIEEVPDGEWYCAKCHVSTSAYSGHANGVNGTARAAKCDLCPFGYGALKRTQKGGWAHVICALYIPEVRFGDVHSMDPVILSDVPSERYQKACYICQQKGDHEAAATGACMSCNKIGCKRGFHVTCAQRQGLLCEEGGGNVKNVKYCGYCDHHIKKASLDSSIKRIPPCRVRAHPSSTVLTSQRTPPSSNNSTSGSTMLVDPIPRPDHVASVLGLSQPATTDDAHLLNNFSPPLTTSSRSSIAMDATPPMGGMPSKHETLKQDAKSDRLSPSTSNLNTLANVTMGQNHNRLDTHTNGHIEEKLPDIPQATPTTSKAATKRQREPKEPGAEKVKRPRQNNRGPKNNMKALLDAVGPVVSETVSAIQRDRVAGRAANTSATPSTSAAHDVSNHIHTIAGSNATPVTTSSAQAAAPVMHPPAVAAVAGSTVGTSPSTSRGMSNMPSSLEQLLERQWDQASQFMISSAPFDVAQLLTCLHQLKSENVRLEQQLSDLSKRREHLLGLNQRLSQTLSIPPQQLQAPAQIVHVHPSGAPQPQVTSPHHSPQVASSSSVFPPADEPLNQMRSLVSGARAVNNQRPPSRSSAGGGAPTSVSFATPHVTQVSRPNPAHQHQQAVSSTASLPSAALSTPPSSQSSQIPAAAVAPAVNDLSTISPERLAALTSPLLSTNPSLFAQARGNQMLPAGMEHLLSQFVLQAQQMRYSQQNPSAAANLYALSQLMPLGGAGGNLGQ